MVRLRTFVIFLLSIYLICTFLIAFHVLGDEENGSETGTKTAAWYNFRYGSNLFGGTWKIGQYGPDIGLGEQGIDVQFQIPFGGYVSYRSTGLGMGLGGPLMGYGGMFSPLASTSYGPYAYGGNPQIQSTTGWGTEGIMAGSLFGPNINYYAAQPGIMGLLFGMFGGGLYPGFGAYGGLGLGGFGFGGFGGYGGWW